MLVRCAIALLTVIAAVPAFAEPMNAEAARHFVAGKLFSFSCFEGTTGSGRIFNDGSVAGLVRMQGAGPVRYMRLPAGTLYPKGGAICSSLKGAFFNPCFELNKTSDKGFRGAISGFGFAYCDFVRRGGRSETIQAAVTITPDSMSAAMRASIRRGRKAAEQQPAAAPTQPVSSAPLPSVEQAVIRSSIAP
jgi:hypothetical protein